jgi:hypothetical protein
MPFLASGLAWIEPAGDGTFTPSPEPNIGVWAHMLPIWDDDNSLIDVVAWEKSRPGVWWLMRRATTHLGRHAGDLACITRQEVWLTTTPDRYLCHYSGHAMCILDWSADLRPIFLGIRGIRCDSPALKQHLDATLAAQAARPEFDVRVA